MKRILFLITTIFLITLLTACNSSNESADTDVNNGNKKKQEEAINNIASIRKDNLDFDIFLIKENGDVIPATPEFYMEGIDIGTGLIQLVADSTDIPTITSYDDVLIQYGTNTVSKSSATKVEQTFPSYNMVFESYSSLSTQDLMYILRENKAVPSDTFFTREVNSINGEDIMTFLTEHSVKGQDLTKADNGQYQQVFYINGEGLGDINVNFTENNGEVKDVNLINCTAYVRTVDSVKQDLEVTEGPVEGSYIVDTSSLENGIYAFSDGLISRIIKIER